MEREVGGGIGMGNTCKPMACFISMYDKIHYKKKKIKKKKILEWVVFPFSVDLPNPGIEPRSSAWQADSLPAEPPEKPASTGNMGSVLGLRSLRTPRDNEACVLQLPSLCSRDHYLQEKPLQ